MKDMMKKKKLIVLIVLLLTVLMYKAFTQESIIYKDKQHKITINKKLEIQRMDTISTIKIPLNENLSDIKVHFKRSGENKDSRMIETVIKNIDTSKKQDYLHELKTKDLTILIRLIVE